MDRVFNNIEKYLQKLDKINTIQYSAKFPQDIHIDKFRIQTSRNPYIRKSCYSLVKDSLGKPTYEARVELNPVNVPTLIAHEEELIALHQGHSPPTLDFSNLVSLSSIQ